MRKLLILLLLTVFFGCNNMHMKNNTNNAIEKRKTNENIPHNLDNRYSAVVLPIENKTGSIEYDSYISKGTGIFIDTLLNSQRFELIEKEKIDKVMEENKIQLSELTKNKAIIQIGELLDADVVILTRVSKVSYVENGNEHENIKERVQCMKIIVESRAVSVKNGKTLSDVNSEKEFKNKYRIINNINESKHLENSYMFEKVFGDAVAESWNKLAEKIPKRKHLIDK